VLAPVAEPTLRWRHAHAPVLVGQAVLVNAARAVVMAGPAAQRVVELLEGPPEAGEEAGKEADWDVGRQVASAGIGREGSGHTQALVFQGRRMAPQGPA
jgi:hypothetical protein